MEAKTAGLDAKNSDTISLYIPEQIDLIETARANLDKAVKLGRKALEAAGVEDILTDQETEILDLISRGEENKSISRHTGLSAGQISYQRSKILQNLAARNWPQAVRTAHQTGILTIPPSDKADSFQLAFTKLSPSELEVLDLAAGGLSGEETAKALEKSVKTVKNQRQKGAIKFGFTSVVPVTRALCEIGYYSSPGREQLLLVEMQKLLAKAQQTGNQLADLK